MSDSVEFFNTQVFINRPATTSGGRHSSLSKIKELKDRAKKLESAYQSSLTQVTQTQSAISKITRETQKVRLNFLKMYENKKMKLMNKQKEQNKKVEDQNHLVQVTRQARQRKLMDELQLDATRVE